MSNLLELADQAKQYFDNFLTNDNLTNGGEKYILTDGERCIVVDRSYTGSSAGTVFRCYRRGGFTVVEAT
ncbi:MAG: hypothetical protein HUU34_16295 [Saprospiraceae bacterium]|nr:hypothetical protein [Saprospiraceae bacterium]